MLQNMMGGRTPRHLIAGLPVVKIEMDARESDTCSEFRSGASGTEFGRLEDGIESVERGAVLKAGIIVGGPPGGRPAETYLSIDKYVESEIFKNSARSPKRIDALAIGSSAHRADRKVRIHLLRPSKRRRKRNKNGYQY